MTGQDRKLPIGALTTILISNQYNRLRSNFDKSIHFNQSCFEPSKRGKSVSFGRLFRGFTTRLETNNVHYELTAQQTIYNNDHGYCWKVYKKLSYRLETGRQQCIFL